MATNGTSVVLTPGAAVNDLVEIVAQVVNIMALVDATKLALTGGTMTGVIGFAAGQTFPGTQTTLVSGTSIKTINGISVLGSGNIQIDGGVVSFNTRTGAVTLSSTDVTTALGFTPVSQSAINSSINAVIDAAPGTLDTLNELAAALGDDPNFATTVTSNIASKLSLSGGSLTGALSVAGTTTATKFIATGGTAADNGMYLPAANTLAFSTNSTERLRVDANGNLGLGVTPSAWLGGIRALDIGSTFGIVSGGGLADIFSNAFFNSSGDTVYKTNAVASRYSLSSGQHAWSVAPSGTAGAIANFTQSMTLSSSGNLGIGTTGPAQRLDVRSTVNSVQARFGNVVTRGLEIGTALTGGTNDATTVLNARGSTFGQLLFQTDGTSRMLIDYNGNVGIGTSSPTALLDVNGTAKATQFTGSGAGLTSIPNSATTATNANTVSTIVARDANGDFLAGGINTVRGLIDTSVANTFRILNPGGAAYYSGVTTGAIQIQLPTGFGNGTFLDTVIRMRITVSDFSGQGFEIISEAWPYRFNTNIGLNYSRVYMTTGSRQSVNTRWAWDGTRWSFFIGNIGDSWNYAMVNINDVQVGGNIANTDLWRAGWNIQANNSSYGTVYGGVNVPTLLATNVSGTVAIANGGTGTTTRQEAMDALAGAVTSGQYLRGNGTDVVMSAIQAADVPTLNQSTTGNAATATTLQTARTINGVSFNGSANITVADTTKLPLAGGTLTGGLSGTTATFSGLIKADGGTIQVGSSAGTYRQFRFDGTISADGTTFNALLHAGNYTSYAPSLTGSGASGTWGISISGTATTATNLSGGSINATSASFSGLITGRPSVGTDVNSNNDTGSLSVRSDSANAASISFHRTGAYAINMGLGTDNIFRIGGWSASANAFRMDGSGNLTMLANVTAYSDERVKTNWRDLRPDFVERLAKVKHGIYDRTDQVSTQVGVSAQSLQKIMEHAVMENADGQLSVAYGNAALVSAVKLAKRVVDQEARIQQLETLINTILNKD